MKPFSVLISFYFLLFYTCERDDICATSSATTPRLIIEFYNSADPLVLKNVPRLSVYGEGLVVDENQAIIKPTSSSNATLLFNSNENNVALPLQIGNNESEVISKFIFEKDTNLRLDDDPLETSNEDIIAISYTPKFEYVSRSCGYKSIFKNLIVSIEDDGDKWISSTNIETDTVTNENTVHVKIFH